MTHVRLLIATITVGLAFAGCGILDQIKNAIPAIDVGNNVLPPTDFGQPLEAHNVTGLVDQSNPCFMLFDSDKWGALMMVDSKLRADGEDGILDLEVTQADVTAAEPIWMQVGIESHEGLPTNEVTECTFQHGAANTEAEYQSNMIGCLQSWADANDAPALRAEVCSHGSTPARDVTDWTEEHDIGLSSKQKTNVGAGVAKAKDNLKDLGTAVELEEANFCGGGGSTKDVTVVFIAWVLDKDGVKVFDLTSIIAMTAGTVYREGGEECEIPDSFAAKQITGGPVEINLGIAEKADAIIRALADDGIAGLIYVAYGNDVPREGQVWGRFNAKAKPNTDAIGI